MLNPYWSLGHTITQANVLGIMSSLLSVTMLFFGVKYLWKCVELQWLKKASSELVYRFSSQNMRVDATVKPFLIRSWYGTSLHWVFCPPILYTARKAIFSLKGKEFFFNWAKKVKYNVFIFLQKAWSLSPSFFFLTKELVSIYYV